ncbi:hypothetical protein BJY04DRAFT_213334 [Aspergillus karnatakaensis]|uniref:uncharacterized protein n=1 Tax=Aspergillus karnatakaensis TaxID=1810916 RepID=UPI003CCDA634
MADKLEAVLLISKSILILLLCPLIFLWNNAKKQYTNARLLPYRLHHSHSLATQARLAQSFKRGTSTPILPRSTNQAISKTRPCTGTKKSNFHTLPLTLQTRILTLALPSKNLIFQPSFHNNTLSSRIATYNANWPKKKHIRNDSDPPSIDFERVLKRGATFLDQTPENIDPTGEKWDRTLICGYGYPEYTAALARERESEIISTSYLSLLTIDRRCYETVLRELYTRHTISFFGVEMLKLFLESAAPEGIQLVRYVHIGLLIDIPISPERWTSASSVTTKQSIGDSISQLTQTFKSLLELDVEIVFLSDSKNDYLHNTLLSNWLINEVFHSLKRLNKFILKTSVLERHVHMHVSGDNLRHGLNPVAVLTGGEYEGLQEQITGM